MVVLDSNSYKAFTRDIQYSDVFVDYVLQKEYIHTANNAPLLILIKNLKNDVTYVANFKHQDVNRIDTDPKKLMELIVQLSKRIFVLDKKRFRNLFNINSVNDVLVYEFQQGYEINPSEIPTTPFHLSMERRFGDAFTDVNFVIPISKHVEKFEILFNHYKPTIEEFESDYSFDMMNGIITETLSEVECNGINIDLDAFNKHFGARGILEKSSTVYSEYNLFTTTGRPSNRFARVNYAALNKEDGCRKSFTSRFGNDGLLLSLDYSAYHPHIVSKLINYPWDMDVNAYEFLGKSYFGKDKLTDEELKKAKNFTFQNFYGGIRKEFMSIEYFKKTDEYIKHRWDFFLKNGYVETPAFKRRINASQISDPNPNKLFNYLLQASETEYSIQSIKRVNDFLRNRRSKVVLYTYDSILIDLCKDDGRDTPKNIKSIMEDGQFPVKVHAGKNYDELSGIHLKR